MKIQKLGRVFESQGQSLLQLSPVLLQSAHVLFLQGLHRLLVLHLDLAEVLVPLLVELLVLHDMSLFHFFPFFGLIVDELLPLSLEVLGFQLFNPVFSHFSLYKDPVNLCISNGFEAEKGWPWGKKDTYQRTFPPSRIAFCVLPRRC